MPKIFVDKSHNIFTLRIVSYFLAAIFGFAYICYDNYFKFEIHQDNYIRNFSFAAISVFFMLIFVLNFIFRSYVYKVVFNKDMLTLHSIIKKKAIKYKDITSVVFGYNLFVGKMSNGQVAKISIRNGKVIVLQLAYESVGKTSSSNYAGNIVDYSSCDFAKELKSIQIKFNRTNQ